MVLPNAASAPRVVSEKKSAATRALELSQQASASTDVPRLQEEATLDEQIKRTNAAQPKSKKQQKREAAAERQQADRDAERIECERLAAEQYARTGKRQATAEEQEAIDQQRAERRLKHLQDRHGHDSRITRAFIWAQRKVCPEEDYNTDEEEEDDAIERDARVAQKLQNELERGDKLQIITDAKIAQQLQETEAAEAHAATQRQVLEDQRLAQHQQQMQHGQQKRRSERTSQQPSRKVRMSPPDDPSLEYTLSYDSLDEMEDDARVARDKAAAAATKQQRQAAANAAAGPSSSAPGCHGAAPEPMDIDITAQTNATTDGPPTVRHGIWKSLRFSQLNDAERDLVRKRMEKMSVVSADLMMAAENTKPQGFLDHLTDRAANHGLNPDHIIPFLGSLPR